MYSSSSLDSTPYVLYVACVCVLCVYMRDPQTPSACIVYTFIHTSCIQDHMTVVSVWLTLSAECHTARCRRVETGQGKFCASKAEGLEANAAFTN